MIWRAAWRLRWRIAVLALADRGKGTKGPTIAVATGTRCAAYSTELLTTYVRQIEVRRTEIAISLRSEDQASEDEKGNPLVLTVPWSKTNRKGRSSGRTHPAFRGASARETK